MTNTDKDKLIIGGGTIHSSRTIINPEIIIIITHLEVITTHSTETHQPNHKIKETLSGQRLEITTHFKIVKTPSDRIRETEEGPANHSKFGNRGAIPNTNARTLLLHYRP